MVAARVAARGVADSLVAGWVATARATDQRWRVAAARAGGSEDDGSERPSDSEVGGEGSAGEGDGNEGAGWRRRHQQWRGGWVTQLRPAHTQRRDRERVAACARAKERQGSRFNVKTPLGHLASTPLQTTVETR